MSMNKFSSHLQEAGDVWVFNSQLSQEKNRQRGERVFSVYVYDIDQVSREW